MMDENKMDNYYDSEIWLSKLYTLGSLYIEIDWIDLKSVT